jgi:hypothetical protein
MKGHTVSGDKGKDKKDKAQDETQIPPVALESQKKDHL